MSVSVSDPPRPMSLLASFGLGNQRKKRPSPGRSASSAASDSGSRILRSSSREDSRGGHESERGWVPQDDSADEADVNDDVALGLAARQKRTLCGHSKAVQLGILNAQSPILEQ